MRARTRWYTFGLLTVSLHFAACQNGAPRESATQFDTEHPGYQLYQRLICARCHGSDLSGTHKAPTLQEIRSLYDRPALRAYLANPDSFQRVDPRLRALNEQYEEFDMPSYPLKDKHRELLIDFLLGEQISSSSEASAES